jgi:hypothetical protein
MTELTTLPSKVRAKFFQGEAGRDYVEITILGDPNTVIRKVSHADTVRFQRDWEAYKANSGELPVEGTPLIEVPGIDKNAEVGLRLKGVRTAEELAGLDEAAAKSLGMGGITFWNGAKNLIKLRQLEAMQALVADAPRRGRPPKAETEAANV